MEKSDFMQKLKTILQSTQTLRSEECKSFTLNQVTTRYELCTSNPLSPQDYNTEAELYGHTTLLSRTHITFSASRPYSR